MAKLYFRYGVMGSSKTANALMVAFNYDERGQGVLFVKPRLDQRDGDHTIRSRTGLERKCLYMDELRGCAASTFDPCGCIIVDEAQFLSVDEVEHLSMIVDALKIPVICYGLRTDFMGNLFPGAAALMAAADSIEEIKTICWCGKKATHNARFDENGKVLKSGEQIVLGANEQYTGLCRAHWKLGSIGPELAGHLSRQQKCAKKGTTASTEPAIATIDSFRGEFEFLSNFYPARVIFGGLTYQNNEAAFQAQKLLNPEARTVFQSMRPDEAKKAGRRCALRADWEAVKDSLMYQICLAKFTQDAALAQKLLCTGAAKLVEGNTWGDHEWGVDGYGQNKLGHILMRVRAELT